MPTTVDILYMELKSLHDHLGDSRQPSFQIIADNNSRRSLILAAASYFESVICKEIPKYFEEKHQTNTLALEFIRVQGISQRYHSFFAWDVANANKFFSLFGPGFKEYMQKKVEDNSGLDESIKAFLEIGSERNRIVHGNFASYISDKTLDDIYEVYKKAIRFIDSLNTSFDEYLASIVTAMLTR